jgi:hypothetical protein
VAGSIASAVYVLAKSLAKGEMPTSGRSVPTSQRTAETVVGQFQTGKGIGWRVILAQLEGVPGISERVVKDQLANLLDELTRRSRGRAARGGSHPFTAARGKDDPDPPTRASIRHSQTGSPNAYSGGGSHGPTGNESPAASRIAFTVSTISWSGCHHQNGVAAHL